ALAETMRTLTAGGMLATDMQGIYDNWATQGLEYYVAARMCWNPSLTYEAILDDYCRTGFGAGAEQVKRYFLLAEKGIVPVGGKLGQSPQLVPETIAEMRALLIAAAKATEADLPAHRRVTFVRAGLEFTVVSGEAHRLKETAESGQNVDAKAAAAVL